MSKGIVKKLAYTPQLKPEFTVEKRDSYAYFGKRVQILFQLGTYIQGTCVLKYLRPSTYSIFYSHMGYVPIVMRLYLMVAPSAPMCT